MTNDMEAITTVFTWTPWDSDSEVGIVCEEFIGDHVQQSHLPVSEASGFGQKLNWDVVATKET